MTAPPPVVLASASRTRRLLLENAGITVAVDPGAVDEDEVKRAMKADGATAEAVATALAESKALRVSSRHPNALIIGADQMLDCDGAWFDKPANRDAARAQLRALSGRTHRLISAAVVAQNGARIWHHVAVARLTMRSLSDGFLDSYLDALGDAALGSVGAYQLEGRGAQLFARVDGDYFTVLGLPLLPLLAFLRQHGVVGS
ncbi:MAG: Maf family protein [Proteobacteria bacterium]|nr:Maf family protein [Pseudomonadota bacterium]